MFCYIFLTSLALLITSDFVKSSALGSSDEEREPLKAYLNTLKNAAEVVKVLKALNEDGVVPESQENYGNQEEKGLQGIDLDYLGLSSERKQNIRELLELITKNRDAKENYYQTRSEKKPRVYYISNPEALEMYKEKIKTEKEDEPLRSVNQDSSNVKSTDISNLWELLKTMRRGGGVNKKVFPKMMIHPRLLHLNLENDLPSFGTNNHEDDEEVTKKEEVKREDKKEVNFDFLQKNTKNDKKEKLNTGLDNLDTTKIATFSGEITEKALRTVGFEYHILDDDIDDQSDAKKDSSDKSDDSDKRVTKIDFKAKDSRTKEDKSEEFDDKSLESYKPKKEKKDKFEFEDKEGFTKKSIETYKSPPKKKEKFDNNDSFDYKKKKQNRWDKATEKTNRWDKSDEKRKKWDKKERSEVKFKPKPRKEERKYEMNEPKIKQKISRPIRNKMTNPKGDNSAKGSFKLFGRTPVPIVGKRGIYDDE